MTRSRGFALALVVALCASAYVGSGALATRATGQAQVKNV